MEKYLDKKLAIAQIFLDKKGSIPLFLWLFVR